MTIKENEAKGIEIEKAVANQFQVTANAQKVQITFPSNSRTFFDFESDFTVYEVKSCHQIIKNGLRKTRQQSRNGRFWIYRNSHFDLKKYADENCKEACYIFVLLDSENLIIKQKSLSWNSADKIIAHIKPRSHGDYGINHELIFGKD